MMHRRTFLKTTLTVATVGAAMPQTESLWGGPVLDTHLHLRRDPDSCYTHMQGSGVSNAVLLTPAREEDKAEQEMQKRPGRFVRSVATDPAESNAAEVIRKAVQGRGCECGRTEVSPRAGFPRNAESLRRLRPKCKFPS